MYRGMEAHWNQLKTLAEQQWARIADVLETMAGSRRRAPLAPTPPDKTRVPAEHRD